MGRATTALQPQHDFFENVDISQVFARFFVNAEAALGGEHRDWPLSSVRTPHSKALLGESKSETDSHFLYVLHLLGPHIRT